MKTTRSLVLTFMLLVLAGTNAWAQTRWVSGRVTAEGSRAPAASYRVLITIAPAIGSDPRLLSTVGARAASSHCIDRIPVTLSMRRLPRSPSRWPSRKMAIT